MKTKYVIIIILLCFIISSCARIVTPTGGDKDIIPPKYVSSKPEKNSVNFKGKSIEINFDEYIVLDNAIGKLIVSPPLKKMPTIGSKLKTLYIKDLDSLQENTTYIFDFGDAITDFTEGNRLSHFSFAFSTGNEIDTLSYQGKILNAYTLKPEPAKFVALYKNHDRQYIRNNLPDYITKSDSLGRFYFQNIKEGEYFILAFEDLNQNMLYDLVTESYGCKMHQQISTIASQDSIMKSKFDTILYNVAEDTVQKILSAKILNERELQFVTFMSVSDEFKIQFTTPSFTQEDTIMLYNKNKDTITVVAKTEKTFDIIEGQIVDRGSFIDNFDLTFITRKKRNKDIKKSFAMSLKEKEVPYFENVCLTLPFYCNNTTYKPLKALCYNDTDTMDINFVLDSNNYKLLRCNYPFKQGMTYTIQIDSMQIFDYNGLYNDTLKAEFHIDSQDDYGSFVISIKDTISSYVNTISGKTPVLLTLFDEKNNQIDDDKYTNINGNVQIFENLREGKYKLRLIIDENGNKKWDKGDFDTAKEPEKVMFFDKTISIRKGWQTQEEWILQ